MAGSPYTAAGTTGIDALTANGSYLFGVEETSNAVVSYSIGSDGALTQASTLTDTNGPASAFMDAAGATVYSEVLGVANYTYDAYAVGQNGSLTNEGSANGGPLVTDPALSFTSNDSYAYGAGCYRGSPWVYSYTRGSNGALTYFDADSTFPAAPSEDSWCAGGPAVSGNTYLVMPLAPMTNYGMTGAGPAQLAVYTIAANGMLTTSSTSSNMPTISVGDLEGNVEFDPTGTYLAVPGSTGLQIYTFSNGTLTSAGTETISGGVQMVAWDTSGNVYALNTTSGQLYVYHTTNGVPAAVSGSPYSVGATTSGVQGLAVAPVASQ